MQSMIITALAHQLADSFDQRAKRHSTKMRLFTFHIYFN